MAEDPRPTPSPYLDPANQAFEQQLLDVSGGKPLTDLTPAQVEAILNELQAHKPNPSIVVEDFTAPTQHGDIKTFIYRPKGVNGPLPVIVYFHGGGWVLGRYDG